MSEKITALFGADVSEVEAKMLVATRATKAYENAVKGIGKAAPSGDLTKSLAQQNEQLAKSMNLLKGGAAAGGIAAVIGQMKSFAAYAKEMGDKASEAQKSAAAWGDEFAALGDTIKGAGASVLGTLAGWGRSVGNLFRDPLEIAADDVAKSSEEMAIRQEAALAKAKAAHVKAADEIPALLKTLRDAQEATANVGRDEMAILFESQIALEKKLDATDKIADKTVRQAERLKIEIELEKNRAKIKELEGKNQEQRDREQAERDKKLAENKAKLDAEDAAAAKKRAEDVAKTQAELDQLVYDRKWEMATKEQKLAQALKEGKEAKARDMFERTAESALALEKARQKYAKLLEEGKGGAEKRDALATGGRQRNEKGQLTRNGVVISEEDAKRSDKTKAENKAISDNGGRRSEDILERIEKLLTPRGE